MPPGRATLPNERTTTGLTSASCVSAAPVNADWNSVRSVGPRRAKPRPFNGSGMSAAAPTPITVFDSLESSIRSEMRRLVLARMFSLTEPDGRWVARIR